MTDEPLAAFEGDGPLRWSALCRLLRALTGSLGLKVAHHLHARRFPAGPAEGFTGGAVDWQEPFDPAEPEALDLGEDLVSVELFARGVGARFALTFLGERTDAGPRWSLELELEEGTPEPSGLGSLLAAVEETLGARRVA